jgi:bifunctional DNA-binding transcriptional regulator/antitoxin component of YhaV-PrlF toxin-antitoxin module
MVKLQEGSNNQKLVTVPRELCKAMGWEKGDELSWSVKDSNTLELKKKSK